MRVLLIEDHEHTRHVLMRLLRRWGFDVWSAPTLQNGLSSLDAGPFDAILSDIALPDGTGYVIANEAKRRWKDVLAIALSGYSSQGDIKIGQLSGFDYHLSKPVNCKQLRSILPAAA
jgi:DNA-binding response OmpR family regulator